MKHSSIKSTNETCNKNTIKEYKHKSTKRKWKATINNIRNKNENVTWKATIKEVKSNNISNKTNKSSFKMKKQYNSSSEIIKIKRNFNNTKSNKMKNSKVKWRNKNKLQKKNQSTKWKEQSKG